MSSDTITSFLRSLIPDPSSPLQLVLLGLAGFFAVRSALSARANKGPAKFSMADVTETSVPTKRDFTPSELAQCNGQDDATPLHIAVRGVVYDVSTARGFYGPGGPYANFAGRDASRGLALGAFDTSILTDLDDPIDTLEDLDKAENEALDEWATFFKGKYVPVGRLVDEPMTPERKAALEKKEEDKKNKEKEEKELKEKEKAEKELKDKAEKDEKDAAAAAAATEESTESKKDI
ncbi:Dihydrodipicolinate synthase [Coemansia aciculifera]|nr:Dihydrodipicolinate synthase [Coemansia aciculifera]